MREKTGWLSSFWLGYLGNGLRNREGQEQRHRGREQTCGHGWGQWEKRGMNWEIGTSMPT